MRKFLLLLCTGLLLLTPVVSYASPTNSNDWILLEPDINMEDEWMLEDKYAKESNYAEKELASEWTYNDWIYIEHKSVETPLRMQIVQYAYAHVGYTPYVWAGRSLDYGTDCSGFTNLIYAHFGIDLPTGSDAYQSYVGKHISYDELLPGDIIVYGGGGHVAIYAGDDMVIHCSSPENGTVYWNMWYRTPTAYVRVIE